ncbi:MAG: PfkB family carbohydrate kinase [Terracidiphilus sp.]|nr:PfkB family carbohydrate kinase [Terracidiphilus sp.]
MANGIFVGLSTIDLVYNVDEFPEANTKIVAHSQDLFAGGPATNAAIAFRHLGGNPTLVTAVGRHALAGAIKEELQRHSISLIDLKPSFDQPPSISSIYVNSAGERNVVSANATRIAAPPAQIDESVLAQASIVLVDGHSMQACQAWARAARARAIPVVLDGGSWKDGTRELLASIDAVICSADFRPPGCFNEDDALRYLLDCGVACIAITCGANPVRFVSGAISGIVPVPQVERVDTMGAGDIFHGAYCYYAASGHGFEWALREAAKVASDSCRFHGTRQWMQRSTFRQTVRGNSASPAR